MGIYKAPKVIVMLDIEAFALGARPIVSQIGMASAAVDDPETILHQVLRKLPFDPQIEGILPARRITASTLIYWLRASEEARLSVASGLEGDFQDLVSLLRAVRRDFLKMTEGLKPHEYEVYSRGPQYDISAVQSLMDECGIPVPWPYDSVRDLRTTMANAQIGTDDVKSPEGLIQHKADDDCVYQLVCLARALEAMAHLGKPRAEIAQPPTNQSAPAPKFT